ncbi:MAG: dihydrodipicolinate reductase [Candidatus Latescibacteria bacterium]|nr:dihydrodipicolinate reductase [Candidatus Latescibacterota bacterium]
MAEGIRAVQYGCGPIGLGVTSLAAHRKDIELVGAVDIDPEIVGSDLGEMADLDDKLGIVITDDAGTLLSEVKPDIAFHTTGSSFRNVYSQLEDIVRAGVNIVSTCEELSFPYKREPDLAAQLDSLAKENGVTVLGTGINPGFLMDTWPLSMTAVCRDVEEVKAVRIQDASSRRLPFQKKIGAGRTPDEFQNLIDEGTLRHVGLPESTAMIAAGLGWELDEITEEIGPVMAESQVSSPHLTVEPGQAAGVKQISHGLIAGKEVVTLEFQAYIGAPETYDAVYIKGTPNMEVVIKGGTHGDIGTAAMVVNAARRVVEAPPGLLTMKDVPVVVCTAGSSYAGYSK